MKNFHFLNHLQLLKAGEGANAEAAARTVVRVTRVSFILNSMYLECIVAGMYYDLHTSV